MPTPNEPPRRRQPDDPRSSGTPGDAPGPDARRSAIGGAASGQGDRRWPAARSRMSGEAPACPICNAPLIGIHCKQLCRNCGYREDCSDLFPA